MVIAIPIVVAYVVGLFAFHRYVVIKTAQHQHSFYSSYSYGELCRGEVSTRKPTLWCDRHDDRIALIFVGLFWPVVIPGILLVKCWLAGVNRPTRAQRKLDKELEREERLREAVAHLSPEDKKFLGIK